jgi:hypothetical protein
MRRPADHAALVAQAREYLSAIRPYKVSQRPHGLLVREAAELRRFLGYALDALAAPTAAITALAPDGSAISLSLADVLEVLGEAQGLRQSQPTRHDTAAEALAAVLRSPWARWLSARGSGRARIGGRRAAVVPAGSCR